MPVFPLAPLDFPSSSGELSACTRLGVSTHPRRGVRVHLRLDASAFVAPLQGPPLFNWSWYSLLLDLLGVVQLLGPTDPGRITGAWRRGFHARFMAGPVVSLSPMCAHWTYSPHPVPGACTNSLRQERGPALIRSTFPVWPVQVSGFLASRTPASSPGRPGGLLSLLSGPRLVPVNRTPVMRWRSKRR